MAEVMNRAARRAAKAVETAIHVVPMGLVEGYYRTQVAREGIRDTPVIVLRPVKAMHLADEEWLSQTLDQMWRARRPGTNRYVFPAEVRQFTMVDCFICTVIYCVACR